MPPSDDPLVAVLDEAAAAVAEAVDTVTDAGLVGAGSGHPGQHHSDLVADAAAVEVLRGHGLGVLSEESGRTRGEAGPDGEVVVVLDPLDGSTNFLHGIPWFATALCAVDEGGLRAAVVRNLATGTTHRAARACGAERDGRPIRPSAATRLDDAIVGLSGWPHRYLGWRQYRALGAAALDLCAVADGTLDGYLDCSLDAHGPWDYLGAVLVLQEAGGTAVDAHGRELLVVDLDARRTVVAGATDALCTAAAAARRTLDV